MTGNVADTAGADQQENEQPAQQGLNSNAQQAQQGTGIHTQQPLPPGGVLRKPKPVGIGHMCRTISTLTGGELLLPPLLCCAMPYYCFILQCLPATQTGQHLVL